MSTDTAYRVTETHEVKVEPEVPKRERRFYKWMQQQAASVRSGVTRAKNATVNGAKRATRVVKNSAVRSWKWSAKTARSAARSGKKAALAAGGLLKRLGNRLLRSGRAFGKGLGNVARFLGRSALTFVKGTGKFLARTSGWTLRVVSGTLRTVLEAAFAVSAASFLVAALLMGIFAIVHDAYQEKVHTHTVAASRGEYREDDPESTKAKWFGPVDARGYAADARKSVYVERDEETGAETVTETTETVVEEKPTIKVEPVSSAGDIVVEEAEEFEDPSVTNYEPEPPRPIDFAAIDWHQAWADRRFPYPADRGVEEHATGAMDLFRHMTVFERDAVYQEAYQGMVQFSKVGRAMDENKRWQNKSYWEARGLCREAAGRLLEEVRSDWRDMLQPWLDPKVDFYDWKKYINDKLKMEAADLFKRIDREFKERNLHKPSMQKGWNDQIGWELQREETNPRGTWLGFVVDLRVKHLETLEQEEMAKAVAEKEEADRKAAVEAEKAEKETTV